MRREITTLLLLFVTSWAALTLDLMRDDTSSAEVTLYDARRSGMPRLKWVQRDDRGEEVRAVEITSLSSGALRGNVSTRRPDGEIETREIVVSEAARAQLEAALSPLRSPRRITQPSATDMQMWQLDTSLQEFEIDDDLRFRLGREGWGHRMVWAQRISQGEVVLLDEEVIRLMRQGFERLPRLALITPLDPSSLKGVSITSQDGVERMIVHHERHDPELRYLGFEYKEGKSIAAQRLVEVLMRARITGYDRIGEDLVPPPKTRRIALSVTDEPSRGVLSIWREEDGRWLAHSPDLHGVAVMNSHDAREIVDAFEATLEAFEHEPFLDPPRRSGHLH